MVAEQKLRTGRIIGILLREGKESGQIATQTTGRPKKESVPYGNTYPETLDEIGISRKQSHTFQQIASIPEESFEEILTSSLKLISQKAIFTETAANMNTSSSLSLRDQMLIKEFNHHMRWLRQNMNTVLQKKEWGTHSDVIQILNRSKGWYNERRLGANPTLIKDKDWRYVGKNIEYKLESIERLKIQITT